MWRDRKIEIVTLRKNKYKNKNKIEIIRLNFEYRREIQRR